MFQFIQVILILTAARLGQPVRVSAGQYEAGIRNLQRDFHTINAHLENKLGKDAIDGELIVGEARELMRSLQHSDNKSLVPSLNLFLSLIELDQAAGLTCNSRGYDIISRNNQALTNLVRYGLRPIDKVAKFYMHKHANQCCSHYPDTYRQQVRGVGKDAMEKVELFAEFIGKFALAAGHLQLTFGAKRLVDLVDRNPLIYILILMDDQSKSSGAITRNRASELTALAQYLRHQSNQFEGQNLRDLVEDYLVRPCRQFTEQVGPDVYSPLEADLNISLDSRGEVAPCDSNSLDFKLGMAYHKLCNMYVLNEDTSRLVELLEPAAI